MCYQQLRTAIDRWVTLTDRQWETLTAIFRIRTLPEQAHLLLPGDYVHELVFVCNGLLRFYYLAEDGVESNKAFAAENDFAGPLAASFLDLPVIYGIQTIESTTLLVADYHEFVALFDEHPIFDCLGRRLAEWFLVRKELRTRSLLQHQAKDRYLVFKEHFPQMVERVPQYHIASYLGMTEVTLSRLKRGLRQEDGRNEARQFV